MVKVSRIPPGVGPKFPQLLTLFGGTGDLAQRKLWPGLYHLVTSGFIPVCRIVGVSLDMLDVEGFRNLVREAIDKFGPRKTTPVGWAQFAECIDYVPLDAGASALHDAVMRAEALLGPDTRRLHYLSVPPKSALTAVKTLSEADLIAHSRVIMEKPFGLNRCRQRRLAQRASLHDVFDGRARSSASTISWARSRRRTFWPSASPTACSSRSGTATSFNHVQIDVPETLGPGQPALALLRGDGRLSRHGGDPPVPDPRLHGDGAADLA